MRARAIRGVHTSPMWYGEVTQPAARPGAAFEPFFAEEVLENINEFFEKNVGAEAVSGEEFLRFLEKLSPFVNLN